MSIYDLFPAKETIFGIQDNVSSLNGNYVGVTFKNNKSLIKVVKDLKVSSFHPNFSHLPPKY